ncbi:unnamed protein product [Microthlaspi erraticum]|uniref:Coatomer alpha subunit C-terminal domain-containing protein n=1 Tax=Microthlaspi erraticum TaxID=1685480 RepID=A0A6D2IMD4_9BRAS|nr:unnamed protein product [Microthlaspi erraticum]
MPVSQIWSQKSSLAAEQAAAGSFDTAMRLLHRQLGIKNFAPLKRCFLICSVAAIAICVLCLHLLWFRLPLSVDGTSLPVPTSVACQLLFLILSARREAQIWLQSHNSGKFTEALRLFLSILQTIPLVVVESRREVDEVKDLVSIVKEYVLGLKMELKRRETKDDPVRQQELAAYFTHCELQAPHLRLALLSAMGVCYKAKNLATADKFARRLLETSPVESQAKMARQVIQAAEQDRKTFRVLTAPLVLYQARKETSARSVILQSLAQTHRFAMLSISSPVNNSVSKSIPIVRFYYYLRRV